MMTIYAGVETLQNGSPVFGPVIAWKHHEAEICINKAAWDEEPAYIPNEDYIPDSSMDLSNANARHLVESLGFAMEDSCAFLPIGQVHKACLRWLNAKARAQGPSPVIASTTSQTATGPLMVDCGLPEGYLDARIQSLLALVVEGQKRGATDIVVG